MKKQSTINAQRRKWLKLAGGSVAFASIGGLMACSDNGSESSAPVQNLTDTDSSKPQLQPQTSEPAASQPEPAEAAADATTEPAAADASDASGAPHLAESNPQAQALGYHEDSSTVDAAKYPNHQSDQACANCALFTGKEGDEWGPCGIFPANQVNAGGWCSAYARKPA